MKPLDFIIIGAQKSGTTSLFKYLEGHPDIYMPPEKELLFFNNDDYYSQGWEQFAERYYKGQSEKKIWGKATPHYLADPLVAKRIHATMPDVKLIVILRNPVDRAYSHYRMSVKRDIEDRIFDQAVTELITSESAEKAREMRLGGDESELYFAWGEYGRLLNKYYEYFSSDQILILFTEHIARDTQAVLDRILNFLDVQKGYIPKNLNVRFHVGGTKRKVPWLSSKIIGVLLEKIPGRLGRRIQFWLECWNTIPDNEHAISSKTRSLLQKYYFADIKKLEKLINMEVPWIEFNAKDGQGNA